VSVLAPDGSSVGPCIQSLRINERQSSDTMLGLLFQQDSRAPALDAKASFDMLLLQLGNALLSGVLGTIRTRSRLTETI